MMSYPRTLNDVQAADRVLRLLRKVNVERLVEEPGGLSEGVGRTFYVDSGSANASALNTGLEPLRPFATLTQAINAAEDSRGDLIYIAAGHAETLTGSINISKAGLTILGGGNGRNRPAFTFNHTADGFSVTADNVKIENLHFVAPSAAVASDIDVGGADCEIANCEFTCGANSTNPIITIPDAGDRANLHDLVFRITANGPTVGIQIESASTDGVRMRNLRSHAGSLTNAWDTAFIYSTVATTDVLIEDILNDFGPTLTFTGAATGLIKDLWPGEIAAGASQLNPGTGTVMVVGGPSYGYLTRRATADIHTAGAVNLFTVTGRVIMTRIILEVTTVIGAGADTLKLTHSPTGGDATDICAASASIATKAVGDTFGITGTYATAMVVGGVAPIQSNPIVLKAGILSSTSTNNTTGSTKVDIYWIPEAPGSAVVIA